MRTILQGFLLTLTMLACKEAVEKKRYKPASSGNINSLLVVMDNDLWQGRVGNAVRLNIGSEVYGLPQKEAYFDFNQVPSAVFSDFVRLNRIILKVQISEKIGASYYKNPYANPQSMVVISAPDRESLIDIIAKEAPDIISKFKSYEFKEKQRRINKSPFNSKQIQTALEIRVSLPSAYRIAKSNKDFFWIRKDIKAGSLNLLLYSLNENKLNLSKSFSDYIAHNRDSISKAFIPGPVDGNYMITETNYTPLFEETALSNTKVFVTKSLWKVEGAFMSGPFVNYCFEDKVKNRLLVAEGFVYAPARKKRDYMFELETIMRSITLE